MCHLILERTNRELVAVSRPRRSEVAFQKRSPAGLSRGIEMTKPDTFLRPAKVFLPAFAARITQLVRTNAEVTLNNVTGIDATMPMLIFDGLSLEIL
jgi:hypothetical protein